MKTKLGIHLILKRLLIGIKYIYYYEFPSTPSINMDKLYKSIENKSQ